MAPRATAVQRETSFLLPTMSVLIPPNTTRMRMDSKAPLLIHEVLANEIMAIIFEEHAKLEWRAPAIDGRVCRLWRQIVLNAPRAWTYLKIRCRKGLSLRCSDLLPWLDRSRTAPLHIRVSKKFLLDDKTNLRTLDELLRRHHRRVASLRLFDSTASFLDRRDFPCLQHLEVAPRRWQLYVSPPVSWGPMPKLRSLRLGRFCHGASLDGLAPLKVLILFRGEFTSLSQHSPSLVTLMLESIDLGDAISGSVDFPSLTYLSLSDMSNLKPHINAPCLVTYHENHTGTYQSFSTPAHSLVEYGLQVIFSYQLDLTEWHNSFPNMSRLSIRAITHVIISILDSLSIHPHLLPALKMISVGDPWERCATFTKKEQETMEDLVRVRSEACHLDVILYYETEEPFHIPLFFPSVSH